jgi:hypothetical protein
MHSHADRTQGKANFETNSTALREKFNAAMGSRLRGCAPQEVFQQPVTALRWLRRGWLLWVLVFCGLAPAYAQNHAEIATLRVEQGADGLYLSSTIRLELPAPVEEALLKGIAMTFVAEAQVYRDRWYWYDKSVAITTRQLRLAYQPLTRRWRLSLGEASASGLGQSFDNLPDALAGVRRIVRWKIADGSEIDTDSRHSVDFRFRLDLSQLPRPMQIGITGNADWNVSAQRNVRPVLPTLGP